MDERPIGERLDIREVGPDNWADFVRLFEGRGGPKYCYCLVWRESSEARKGLDLAGRRALMQQRVEGGTPVGLLAYLDGAPVGWCSVAPRETYRPLGGLDYPAGTAVWAVACFFVQRALRGQGTAAALLEAAVATAKRHGAQVVEATPVNPDSPAFRFMGYRPMFRAAGFEDVHAAGSRRHVMHRVLSAPLRRRLAST